ncbi:unnamed protein product [Effrenium voratum]|uniref:Uncharacterized protein n=1 Tax=Effrenium voratum TaxID=2562239 RepID=A0AA36HLB6_9DINO|nr:unnamed protein product [Effrenium voratum]
MRSAISTPAAMAAVNGYPEHLRQSFAASPRPASGSSRKTSSSARSASPEERQVSTANEAQVWAAPRRPPAGAEASQRWLEEMDNLQRDYNEVLRSIDARFSQRMNTLRGQLESWIAAMLWREAHVALQIGKTSKGDEYIQRHLCSMSHELPPSYPPSDVSRETEPELVETDPEVVSP